MAYEGKVALDVSDEGLARTAEGLDNIRTPNRLWEYVHRVEGW